MEAYRKSGSVNYIMCGLKLTYDDGNTESTPIGSGCSSQVTWTSTGSGKIAGVVWKDGLLIDAVGFYFINKATLSTYNNFVYDTSSLPASITPSSIATFLVQNGNSVETEVTQSWEECKGTSESWSASTTTSFSFTQSVEVSASVFEIVEASSNSEFGWQEDTTTESTSERSTETCSSVSVVVTIEAGKALHAHVTQGNGTASLPWTADLDVTFTYCSTYDTVLKACINTATGTLTFTGKVSGTYKNVAASRTVHSSWVCDYTNGVESNCNSGSALKVASSAAATSSTTYWLHTVRGNGITMEGIVAMSGIPSSTIYSLNGGASKVCKSSSGTGHRHLLQAPDVADDITVVKLHEGAEAPTDAAKPGDVSGTDTVADLAAPPAPLAPDSDNNITNAAIFGGRPRLCFNRFRFPIPCPPVKPPSPPVAPPVQRNVTGDARPADLKCIVAAGTVLRLPHHPAVTHISSKEMFPDLHDVHTALREELKQAQSYRLEL